MPDPGAPETPTADALEQAAPVVPEPEDTEPDRPVSDVEANPADVVEQEAEVTLDEDEQREDPATTD